LAGTAVPYSAMAPAPSGSGTQSTVGTPATDAVAASTTRTAAGTISGPMPSPSSTPSR
jgi:hypothetical protein